MPYLVGDLPDGFLRVICAGYSGVVDEDVDAAELGDGALDEGVDFLESVTSVDTAMALPPLARMVSTVSWMGPGLRPAATTSAAKLGEGHGDLSTEA